ncbi:MAG: hypothetical protein IBJ08_06060 [Pseudomonas sp.]|nr:hypothetical protein [Pseudomonas sp.]
MSIEKPTFWHAANDLSTAAHVLSNLHALFTTMAKSEDRTIAGLARIGQGITEEWEETLGDTADKLFAADKAQKKQVGGGQ